MLRGGVGIRYNKLVSRVWMKKVVINQTTRHEFYFVGSMEMSYLCNTTSNIISLSHTHMHTPTSIFTFQHSGTAPTLHYVF